MPEVDETHSSDPGDSRTAGDEFATQLATVVFEWRATRVSSVPPAPTGLWMSRSARRSGSIPS
jgi:hypothetical protein